MPVTIPVLIPIERINAVARVGGARLMGAGETDGGAESSEVPWTFLEKYSEWLGRGLISTEPDPD